MMKKMHKDGNIKIVLQGKKLKGAYHLVEMKGKENHWLLMKAKDEFSGSDKTFDQKSVLSGLDLDEIAKTDEVWHSNKTEKKSKTSRAEKSTTAETQEEGFSAEDVADAKKLKTFPDNWRPQLATLTDEAFDNDDWIFENKYDGYRALVQIKDGKANLISRNGISFNKKYKALVATFDNIFHDMILDGEIVVEDKSGKSHFQWLQNFEDNPDIGKLKFYAFDILYFKGFDLRGLELLQRKKILKAILPKSDNLIFSAHTVGKGIETFKAIEKLGGEGIIAKKSNSKYAENKRTKDWLKIKTEQQQEMVIGGYTDPQGGRKGIGALICGYYENGELLYSGKVGSGFDDESLSEMKKKLEKLEIDKSPFKENPRERGVHWVKPQLVAQIKFSEWTETNSMRHPVFLGLREDKKAGEVKKEKASQVEIPKSKTQKSDKSQNSKSENSKVEITHPDKIYFPKEKITKGDVIAYYDSVSEYILPYLKDRPQSLRRTPNGIDHDGFFQKNVEGMVPPWIKTRKIKSKSAEDSITYLLCQDKDTLLFLANWGCIELNPWSSRVGTLNNPDYIIFDLNPNGADIKKIVKTALKLKEILDMLKVPAYIKTSGGKGIHVFIPVLPKYTYDQTREFSHLVSQMVLKQLPDIVSLERMPDKRKNKVYLDFLQNGKGKTMASIYSLRPREGAGVSTPLEWTEINDKLDLKKFNIKTIPKRLEEKGDLWADFFEDAIDLKSILATLGN
ncbi:DNA ligase D [Flavobacterium sp. 3HN19-14]|uniref:DNA ligase D n=1 Tax=Flavobacterium sp. 3HN19-14 TaxID=3448133 RepID=UPI003EDFEFE0